MKRGDNLKLFPSNYESCNNFAHFIIIGTTSPETDYIEIARLLVPLENEIHIYLLSNIYWWKFY